MGGAGRGSGGGGHPTGTDRSSGAAWMPPGVHEHPTETQHQGKAWLLSSLPPPAMQPLLSDGHWLLPAEWDGLHTRAGASGVGLGEGVFPTVGSAVCCTSFV